MKGVRGNPTVLLPRSHVAHWPGANAAIPESAKGWSLAARGDGFAGLALNSPEQTMWFPLRDGGVLLQCACVPDDMNTSKAQEQMFRRVVAKLPSSGWKRASFTYDAVDDDSLLFDGGFEGAGLDNPKDLAFMDDEGIGRPWSIKLPTGRYAIDVLAPFVPVADAELYLFRLTRTGAAPRSAQPATKPPKTTKTTKAAKAMRGVRSKRPIKARKRNPR
jgi:hypothetical protein